MAEMDEEICNSISGAFEVHLITKPEKQMQLFGVIEDIKKESNKDIINPRPTCAYALYGKHPNQPMMTFWLHGSYSVVFERANQIKSRFESKGIPIIRTKIESMAHNKGVPEYCKDGHYFEYHFKVTGVDSTKSWDELVFLLVFRGAHLFHNPFNKNLVPIVTLRSYVSLTELDNRYQEVLKDIQRHNDERGSKYEPEKHVEKEYSVLDDNVGLDEDWLYSGAPHQMIMDDKKYNSMIFGFADSLLGKSLGKTNLARNSDSLLGKSLGKTNLARNSDSLLESISKVDYKLEPCFVNDHIYLKWRGKYTVGDVSIRGTRVWLRSSCAEVVQSGSLSEMNAKTIQNDIENKDFPGDYVNLRDRSLEKIINKLSVSIKENYCVERRALKGLLNKDDIDEMLSDNIVSPEYLNKEQLILVDYDIIWENENGKSVPEPLYVVHDLANIIKELGEVLKYAKENNVTWTWV
jgi:hypothetical protein